MSPEAQQWVNATNQTLAQYGSSAETFNLGSGVANYNGIATHQITPGFAQNLGNALGSTAGVLGHIGASLIAPITGLGHDVNSIVQAYQQNKFNSQATDQINAQIKQYARDFRAGRIDAQRYSALIKDSQKQLDEVGKNISRAGSLIPSKGKVAMDVLGTAVTPLAFGRLEAANSLARAAEGAGAVAKVAQAGQKVERVAGGIKPAEQMLHGTPTDFVVNPEGAARATTTAEKVASKSTPAPNRGSVVSRILKAPIKDALIEQPTAQAAVQTPIGIKNHDYKGTALNVAVFGGVPAGVALAGRVAPKIGEMFRAERNFANSLVFKDGKTIESYLNDLKTTDPVKYQEEAAKAKVAIDHMIAEGRTPGDIAKYHVNEPDLQPLEKTSVEDFLQHNNQLATESEAFKSAAYRNEYAVNSEGKKLTNAQKELVGAGKFDQGEREDLIRRLQAVPADERGRVILEDMNTNRDYTRNPGVLDAIKKAADIEDPNGMAKAIKDLNVTRSLYQRPAVRILSEAPKVVSEKPSGKLSNGMNFEQFMKATGGKTEEATAGHLALPAPKETSKYFPIIKPKGSAGFRTADEVSDAVLSAKRGSLAPVTEALRKLGLGIEGSDSSMIRAKLAQNLQQNLKDAGVKGDSRKILSAIDDYVEKHGIGAADGRMLTKNELSGALATISPNADAGAVRSALSKAYADVPKELQGIGPQVVNKAIAKAPALAKYLRVQGIGRYEMNPFFFVKQDVKGAYIVKAEGGELSKALSINPQTMAALKERGFLNAGGRSGTDVSIGDYLGENGTKLMRPNQQRLVGALAQTAVDNSGKTLDQIFKEDGPLAKELEKSLKLVHGYGDSGYLNSPMAKTLNLVIFPSRFETKVAGETAKIISKLHPVAQASLVRSLGSAHQWLNSPEGKQWQKANSAEIQLIKYFTPLSSIDGVSNFLTKGFHAGDLGELGGLPIGVVQQMLNHQGIPLGPLGDSTAINPSTGQPYTEKIPEGVKARAQQALTDFVGSLYSYPGRTAGLSSKTDVTQTVLPFLKPNPKSIKTINPPSSTPTTSGAQTHPVASMKSFKSVIGNVKTESVSGEAIKRRGRIKTVPKSMQIPAP